MALGFLYGAGGGGASIPDGATVLPVGDVYTLQRCAGIKDPQYTTLAELLADATTLAHVIDSANAMDYLVRSKTWINNTSRVPTMTSDTTPSGECFGSGIWSGAPNKWQAFDGDDSTRVGFGSSTTGIIGYRFEGEPLPVNSFSILSTNNSVPSYKIEGSNDGTNYTELGSYSDLSATKVFHEFNNNTSYKYLRCYIPNTTSSGCYVYSLQFYGASILLSATAMSLIGANNYASNTLLADSDWEDAIWNSPYRDSVLNLKVPTMTSNTTPSGECITSAAYSSEYYAYKAFDNNTSTRWNGSNNSATEYIGYDFKKDVRLRGFTFSPYYDVGGLFFKSATLQGFNGTSWIDIKSISVPTATTLQTFAFAVTEDATSYSKFRLYCTDSYKTSGSNKLYSLIDLQFYGREDV